MRKSAVAVFALATMAATMPHASASAPTTADTPCSMIAVTTGADASGTMTGGPIAQSGVLTCTLQAQQTHAGADITSRTAVGIGSTTLAPQSIPYQVTSPPMYVCSSFQDATLNTYYHDNATGNWTTSTSGRCVAVTNIDATPLREISDYTPGFPPAGFAVTSIGWLMTPGSTAPAFQGPQSNASHPARWSCPVVTYDFAAKFAHAECSPVAGQEDPGFTGWSCYDPYVNINVANSPGFTGDTVRGTSRCGTKAATCAATTSARQPSAQCSGWAGRGPVPFVCDADFSGASLDRTAIVRCATIDP